MLVPEQVEQIRYMLSEGTLSKRRIARMLGVSRFSVNAIAHGRRTDYRICQRISSTGADIPDSPAERCPGCGAMVQMPCLACRLRALLQSGKLPHVTGA